MLPGPVFNLELLTTARRPRYYAIRVAYGAAILVVLSINYSAWNRTIGPTYSPRQMAEFAATAFGSFAALQGFAVLGMTPALVSGVIADEKQRKTLHYLLASPLTSGEIVFGKLAARMLHVFVFLAIGLPIVSLLSLFGGVDPVLVLVCEVVTASTAFFLAAMGVLISTSARRVRDAIAVAYSLELAWLLGPTLLRSLMMYYWPETAQNLDEPLKWLNATDPLGLLWQFAAIGRGGGGGLIESAAWMVGLQIALGGLMTAVAMAKLRPVFRAQADAPKGLFRLFGPRVRVGRFRFFARPAVGDHAMFWKELHTSRGGGIRQVAEFVLLTIVLGSLVVWAGTFAVPAFTEMMRSGYAMDVGASGARVDFNWFLRISGAIVCTLAALSTATAASNGLTSEKEEDTWTALLSTPLEARDIILPKMLGAVWRSRAVLGTVLGLWIVGVFCGSVHPFGLVFAVIEAVVFLGFASALGTTFSLRSKSSWRAQSLALGVWMFVNFGYGFCCCPIAIGFNGAGSGGGALFAAGCSPFIQGISLISPADLGYLSGSRTAAQPDFVIAQFVAACLIGVVGYAGAAAWLTASTLGRFDDAVDRPHRAGISFVSIQALATKAPKDADLLT